MHSLYRRLTMTHTLVALLAVLIVGALASGLIVRVYRQLNNEQTLRQSRAIATRLRTPLGQLYVANRGWSGAAMVVGQRLEEGGAVEGRVVLVDESGIVIFDSNDELTGRQATPRVRLVSVPVMVRGREVGSVAVLPSPEQAAEAEQTFVRSLVVIVGAGSLAATLGALLVALLVARRLVRPMRQLTMAANRLADGERHEPIVAPNDAELADLAQAFNSMAGQLAHQEELRRMMVADIAHELRTPLSVLRLQVESMEDGLLAPSPQSLGALSNEIDLLGRLVDDLRLISLAEAGQLSLSIGSIDPQQAIEDTALAAGPRARQSGVELRVEHNGKLPDVRADAQRLAQVLGNLVENALRYTPAGGTVTLGAALADGKQAIAAVGMLPQPSIVFSITDTGPGIPADELEHIFERFYRTDRARARETGGSGLGLAIVQRLVAAQGGRVSVDSRLGQGSSFRVFLPIA